MIKRCMTTVIIGYLSVIICFPLHYEVIQNFWPLTFGCNHNVCQQSNTLNTICSTDQCPLPMPDTMSRRAEVESKPMRRPKANIASAAADPKPPQGVVGAMCGALYKTLGAVNRDFQLRPAVLSNRIENYMFAFIRV